MSSAMMATIGQLLRSGQRDHEYTNQMNDELNQIIQNWFGVRHWLHLRPYLPQMSQIIYYSVTTLSGLQTLGEEYVNIVQIDGNKRVVPRLLKRFVALLLQTFSPYLLSRLLVVMKRRIENKDIVLPWIGSSDHRRHQLLKLIAITEESFDLIHRIHLICFYLTGNYFYLSKRVIDIKYLSLNRSIGGTDPSTNRLQSVYKVVGYLTLSQLLISFLVKFYSSQNSSLESSDDSIESNKCDTSVKSQELEVNVSHKCSLCLEKRRQTTATTCGHLFCWKCITEWLRLKTECPLCRQPLQSYRLVLLNNYI